MSKLIVKMIKSTNRATKKQARVVEALGLKKIGQTAEHQDNEAIRGMVKAVPHLVAIVEEKE